MIQDSYINIVNNDKKKQKKNIIFFCMFYYHVVQDPKPMAKKRAGSMWAYNKDINIHNYDYNSQL